MDGNGRTARFVMNSQLVTSGFPWMVITIERWEEYMAALEKASVEGEWSHLSVLWEILWGNSYEIFCTT